MEKENSKNLPTEIEEELKKLPADFSGTIEIPINTDTKQSFQEVFPGSKPLPEEIEDFEKILWGGNAPADMPVINYGDEYVVVKGEKLSLNNSREIATLDEVINAIKTVSDPEIMVNVFDMGLIYRLDRLTNGDIEIDMTVTAPSCPVAGLMPNQVAEAVATLEGVGQVTVKLVWEPAWSMDRMSEDAKYALDLI
ncbi:MAG: iron-sulfur cluster assembly protein [Alphaproteobacteria bacterium]|nr:iron-sulfur cluster assembly protein [Alphaproteobacteria bacterium]